MDSNLAASGRDEKEEQKHLPQKTSLTQVGTFLLPENYANPIQQRKSGWLRDYLTDLWGRKYLMIAVMMLAVLAGIIGTTLIKPIYRATAILEYIPANGNVKKNGSDVASANAFSSNSSDQSDLQTQIHLLNSRTLAELILPALTEDELSLVGDQHMIKYDVYMQRLSRALSDLHVDAGFHHFGVREKPIAADQLMAAIDARSIPETFLIELDVVAHDPEIASKIANLAARHFMDFQISRQLDGATSLKSHLEDMFAETKNRYEAAEKAVKKFRSEYPVVTPEESAAMLEQYESRVAEAQRLLSAKETNQQVSLNPQDLAADEETKKLLNIRKNLETEYQQKLIDLKPKHPDLLALEEKKNKLDEEIASQKALLQKNLQNQRRNAASILLKRQQELENFKQERLKQEENFAEYTKLQEEATRLRRQYDDVQEISLQILSNMQISAGGVVMVENATPPLYPFKPVMQTILLWSLMTGILLAAGVASLLHLRGKTYRFAREIEQDHGYPVIATVNVKNLPNIKSGNKSSLDADGLDKLSDAYKSVADALYYAKENGLPSIICITSAQGHEGECTTAVGLAASFAQHGRKVLIIDVNLKSPTLHGVFGTTNQSGITNILASAELPLSVTHETAINNLYLITAGPCPANSMELLAGKKMHEFLLSAKDNFDVIVLHAPSINSQGDMMVIGPRCEAVLISALTGKSRRAHLAAAIKKLHAGNIKPIGFVLARNAIASKSNRNNKNAPGHYQRNLVTSNPAGSQS